MSGSALAPLKCSFPGNEPRVKSEAMSLHLMCIFMKQTAGILYIVVVLRVERSRSDVNGDFPKSK